MTTEAEKHEVEPVKNPAHMINVSSIAYLMLLHWPDVVHMYAHECAVSHAGRVFLDPGDDTDSAVLPKLAEYYRLQREFYQTPNVVDEVRFARRLLGVGVFKPNKRAARASNQTTLLLTGVDALRDMALMAADALLNPGNPLLVEPASWYGRLSEFINDNMFLIGRPMDREPWLAQRTALRAYLRIRADTAFPALSPEEYARSTDAAACDELLKQSAWYERGLQSLNPGHLMDWQRQPVWLTPRQQRKWAVEIAEAGAALEEDINMAKRTRRFLEHPNFNLTAAINLAGEFSTKKWGMSDAANARLIERHPALYDKNRSLPPIARARDILEANERYLAQLVQEAAHSERDETIERRDSVRRFVEKLKQLLGQFSKRGGVPAEPVEVAARVVSAERTSNIPYVKGFSVPQSRGGTDMELKAGRSLFEFNFTNWLANCTQHPRDSRNTPRNVCEYCGEKGTPSGIKTVPAAALIYDREAPDGIGLCQVDRYYLKGHKCPWFDHESVSTAQFMQADVIGGSRWILHISAIAYMLHRYQSFVEAANLNTQDKAWTFSGAFGLGTEKTLAKFLNTLNTEAVKRLNGVRVQGKDPFEADSGVRIRYQQWHEIGWLAEVLRWGMSKLVPGSVVPPVAQEKSHAEEHSADSGVGGNQESVPVGVPEVPEIQGAAVGSDVAVSPAAG